MRLARFRDGDGNVHRGELHGDLEADDAELTADGGTFAAANVELLAPCEPSKLVCVGRNYADHAAEMDSDVPDRPLLFLKPPNAVAAHGERVTMPSGKERIDHEAELAVVVGERATDVSAADAMDHVEGFTCLNDLSNRDDQNREQNWVRGKAFDQSAPVGPVVATPDEVPDDAFVRARVDGERRQDGSREQFVFSVPDLLAEITAYVTLEPGDVVATGTPAGVGPLADGDVVEIEVEGVGTLRNEVHIP
jgi:2-keto-4-pentenoate hydratase/2-oxohepta-3-ene-1,7-dioic acid hydratase in catechol pathway